jgi:hypothetical protein
MAEKLLIHVPRVNFDRRLEPAGDVVLHGVGQSPEAFRQFFRTIGDNKPALYMTYVSLDGDIPGYFKALRRELDEYRPFSIAPQIGLHMTGVADDNHHPEQHYERQVAEGQYDDQIQAFSEGLRWLNRPAFVRIGFEFNGPWFGYEPESYKVAWVRIVSALRRHEHDDVAAVWCYYPLPHDDYMTYYPGDEYVDWWAIDLFDAAEFTAGATLAFMEHAERKRYPIMIGESTPRSAGGVTSGEAAWHEWFTPYFEFIRKQPTVKAFCYINWDWTKYPVWHDWGDARIETNEVVMDHYRQELLDSLYRHATANEKGKQYL